LERLGAVFGQDNLDDLVEPIVAQHLTDYWALQRFAEHPLRTRNVDEADVHIVGAPIALSYFASAMVPESVDVCSNYSSHLARLQNLAETLEELPAFQRSNGANFLLLLTPPFKTGDNLEMYQHHTRFSSVLIKSQLRIATIDKGLPPYVMLPPHRKSVVPYKAHYLVEGAALQNRSQTKDIDIMFHGTFERDSGIGGGGFRRDLLEALQLNFSRTSFVENDQADVEKMTMDQFANMTRSTAETYLRTRLCLILEGNTLTSRRLYEALAAGCVPVIYAPVLGMSKNLPFINALNWSQIALFGGPLECATRNITEVVEFLNMQLQDTEKIERMASLGQQAFRESLSYTSGHGLVENILRDVRG
jgi:hypothetical protein